jgi:predicted GNAT family N-acyltransferase
LRRGSAAARSGPCGVAYVDQTPVIRIARLVVDRRVQKIGLGSELLNAALLVANEQSKRIGCAAVVVDAREDSVGFYERFGFERTGLILGGSSVRPRPVPMILSIAKYRRALTWPRWMLRGMDTTVERDET